MVLSGIIDTILQGIFGFQYLVDIVIGIFLLVAFGIGFSRGMWRSLWRLVFIVLVLALVNVFALPALETFVNEGFWTMTGMAVTMDLGGTPVVFTSVQQFVSGISQYAVATSTLSSSSLFADADFLLAFSLALSRLIGWLIVVMVTMVVSWLVSGLLWLILWGPLLKSVKKKKVKFVGGLLGAAQGYVYALLFAISFSPIANGLAAIQNPLEAPYAFGEVIPLAAGGLRPENSLILSITTPNNPFGFFTAIASFEFDGTTYDLTTTIVDFIEATDTPA